MKISSSSRPLENDPSGYERRAVALLTIGFGLVGLDRWSIAPLFPIIAKDLHLNYQDLGNITGVLAVAWGVFAIITGGLSDKFGRRGILVGSIVAFSAMAGLTGLATGLTVLVWIRVLMGVFEGAFCPTSISATYEASDPSRRGLNLGIQQSGFALVGLGLGPIITTQLLQIVPSWRWVFLVVSLPGFVVAYLLFQTIREPGYLSAPPIVGEQTKKEPWRHILKYRNVVLGMLGLFGVMSCIFVLTAMVPTYLIDYLKIRVQEMGFVTSAFGWGGTVGSIVVPGLSDRIGRKLALTLAFLVALVLLLLFSLIGSQPVLLFVSLFALTGCCSGAICVIAGPIVTEAVPASLVASAAGIAIGAGEIFGGGVMPSIAGYVAEHFGLQHTLSVGLFGLFLGFLVSCFLKETAPFRLQKSNLGEKREPIA